jgi:hypothetical protein
MDCEEDAKLVAESIHTVNNLDRVSVGLSGSTVSLSIHETSISHLMKSTYSALNTSNFVEKVSRELDKMKQNLGK